ncbi:olfactory receptor 51G2-like [Struthio camelus]|uniref:olfactory receptor 51G2-like n=1 Tax=Struthio camelus TaxID=8801 RepID=UPI0036040A6E
MQLETQQVTGPGANISIFPPLTFLLTGVPGLEHSPHWLAAPVCALYLLSALGNGTVLFIILTEPSLHTPMYLLLLMLAVADLGLSTSVLPTMLGVFLSGSGEVSSNACFSQLFFIHAFSIIESSVLLAMAFDRFVAICYPLRYNSILTNARVLQISLVIAIRAIALHAPLPFLLQRLPYRQTNILSHSYCLHPDVMKLAHAGSRESTYTLFIVLSTMGLDPVLIVLSYAWILRSVLGLVLREEHVQALSTCLSHISVVLIFYIPMLALSLINHLGLPVPAIAHSLLSFLHFLVPPVLNPMLYCVRMKEIRGRVARRFLQAQGTWGRHCRRNQPSTKFTTQETVGSGAGVHGLL